MNKGTRRLHIKKKLFEHHSHVDNFQSQKVSFNQINHINTTTPRNFTKVLQRTRSFLLLLVIPRFRSSMNVEWAFEIFKTSFSPNRNFERLESVALRWCVKFSTEAEFLNKSKTCSLNHNVLPKLPLSVSNPLTGSSQASIKRMQTSPEWISWASIPQTPPPHHGSRFKRFGKSQKRNWEIIDDGFERNQTKEFENRKNQSDIHLPRWYFWGFQAAMEQRRQWGQRFVINFTRGKVHYKVFHFLLTFWLHIVAGCRISPISIGKTHNFDLLQGRGKIPELAEQHIQKFSSVGVFRHLLEGRTFPTFKQDKTLTVLVHGENLALAKYETGVYIKI